MAKVGKYVWTLGVFGPHKRWKAGCLPLVLPAGFRKKNERWFAPQLENLDVWHAKRLKLFKSWLRSGAKQGLYKRKTIYYHAQTSRDNACEREARHSRTTHDDMRETTLRHARQCARQRATRVSQRDYAREQHDDAQMMSCANNNQQIIN
jgi:hypothetical protein